MASLSDLFSSLQQAVQAINQLNVTLKATYTQIANTTATSATAGSASALPATPQVYLNVTVAGVAYKIPAYKP